MVVARELCLYHFFDFSGLSPVKAKKALAIKIEQISPFTQTGSYMVWVKSAVQVWLWDQALTRDLEGGSFVPESAFSTQQTEGLVQLKLSEGIELQYWADNQLTHSRFSATEPAKAQLAMFCRSIPGCEATEYKSLQILLSAKPWGLPSQLEQILAEGNIKKLTFGVAVLFLALIAYDSAKLLQLTQVTSELEQDITLIQDELSGVLAEKDKALSLRRTASKYEELVNQPRQLDIMGQVVEHTPASAKQVIEWHFQQDKLRVIYKGQNMDPREFVQALSKAPLLHKVKTEPGFTPDLLIVSAEIR